MSVSHLNAHRDRKQSQPPARAPDFTASGWMERGEVSWVWTDFIDAASRRTRAAALIDSAWMIQRAAEVRGEQPAVWWLLDNDGTSTLLWSKDLYEGTTWRHACWLVRQWWRLTKRLLPIAYRVARGR